MIQSEVFEMFAASARPAAACVTVTAYPYAIASAPLTLPPVRSVAHTGAPVSYLQRFRAGNEVRSFRKRLENVRALRTRRPVRQTGTAKC